MNKVLSNLKINDMEEYMNNTSDDEVVLAVGSIKNLEISSLSYLGINTELSRSS